MEICLLNQSWNASFSNNRFVVTLITMPYRMNWQDSRTSTKWFKLIIKIVLLFLDNHTERCLRVRDVWLMLSLRRPYRFLRESLIIELDAMTLHETIYEWEHVQQLLGIEFFRGCPCSFRKLNDWYREQSGMIIWIIMWLISIEQ